MKRKKPVRHHVNSHMRQSKRVRAHWKGSGQPKPKITRRRIPQTGTATKPKAYTVNFRYSDKKGDGESVVVISTRYKKALDEAFEEKKDARQPIEIEIIDPNLGRMLHIIGKGVAKVAKLGIKYSYKGVKVLGREAAHAVAKSYRELRLRRLIDEAYSEDRVTRVMARAKLKQRYPEIARARKYRKKLLIFLEILNETSNALQNHALS